MATLQAVVGLVVFERRDLNLGSTTVSTELVPAEPANHCVDVLPGVRFRKVLSHIQSHILCARPAVEVHLRASDPRCIGCRRAPPAELRLGRISRLRSEEIRLRKRPGELDNRGAAALGLPSADHIILTQSAKVAWRTSTRACRCIKRAAVLAAHRTCAASGTRPNAVASAFARLVKLSVHTCGARGALARHSRHHVCNLLLNPHLVRASTNPSISRLSPTFAPRIGEDPIVRSVSAPTNQCNSMCTQETRR